MYFFIDGTEILADIASWGSKLDWWRATQKLARVEDAHNAIPNLQMMGNDNLYCRYVIEHGGDWNVIEVGPRFSAATPPPCDPP